MAEPKDRTDTLMDLERPVVLFDGECSLCNEAVRVITSRDHRGCLLFMPLQAPQAHQLLQGREKPEREILLGDSLLLVEGRRIYHRSTAALRIARYMRGLWPLLYLLILVPRPLRDAVYTFIARRRHRWRRRESPSAPAERLPDGECRTRANQDGKTAT